MTVNKDSNDIRNLRDYWGYFNAQVESENQILSSLKLQRLIGHTKAFVDSVNARANKTLGAFIDLSTKAMMIESTLEVH